MATAPVEVSNSPEVGSTNFGVARIVREGLMLSAKKLPPWLFYDEAGSLLFEQITALPEYYLTRIERELLTEYAGDMIEAAAAGERVRLVELGAGSADKTRTLISAALARQDTVEYRPVDVSESALEAACERIAAELPKCRTTPTVADYTIDWVTQLAENTDRELLLWIGSSIGNFEPDEAALLLKRINRTMQSGDGLLLGVDLAPVGLGAQHSYGGKSEACLVSAYDDAAGVTAAFNRNLLVRLNRELDADFKLDAFAHRAVWNAGSSRMEMHLESLAEQWVRIEALDLDVHFAEGERIHTENSYKYTTEKASMLMAKAGFPVVEKWMDPAGWFAVFLGRKG